MKDNNFASADLTMGQLNALVKKIGGKGKVLDFLAGRLRLTQFFDYKDGVIYLTIENPALITSLEWVLQLEKRFDDFYPKFKNRIDGAQAYHTFDRITVCVFNTVLTESEMEKFNVVRPNPNLVFQLQKIIPDQGILLMGYRELLIMHEPISRTGRKQKPAQMGLLLGGSIYVEGFRGRGNHYPQGTGFVYLMKK